MYDCSVSVVFRDIRLVPYDIWSDLYSLDARHMATSRPHFEGEQEWAKDMSETDFFTQTALDLDACGTPDQEDAALGAYLLLYLRQHFDAARGTWRATDDRDTLRQSCHAVEVLHRLNFDVHSRQMVRDGGDWLINMPFRDRLTASERSILRLYPSRFKTLSYLDRFDDDQVREDFANLLSKEVKGMLRNVGESDVLTTCITLDTLLTLERRGQRRAVCSDSRFNAIVAALLQQFKAWKPGASSAPLDAAKETSRRTTARAEIDNPRDLSYVLGLLLQLNRSGLPNLQVNRIFSDLLATLEQRDRARHSDIVSSLYVALQLVEHFHGEERVQAAIAVLLRDVRDLYARPDAVRRWDLATHVLVLRLLLTLHDAISGESLSHAIAAHLLLEAEHRRASAQNTLDVDLTSVIRERMLVRLGAIAEISGGFTNDRIFRVPFSYWFPVPGFDGERYLPNGALPNTSIIIKRSTSDAFYTATSNYSQLPPRLRAYFVRQPAESQVYKSSLSSAYYLPMEDLADMATLYDVFNEIDQRAVSTGHLRLLQTLSEHVCQVSFALFSESAEGQMTFPGTQLARLYLSRIEKSLMRGMIRVPWLKNLLQGFHVATQRYKGLDYYLAVINRHATMLQPRALGLAHGDFHARNIMVNTDGDEVKLIDLDKLDWSGDYLADLGNLLTDVCIYRRVSEPDSDYGLARADIALSKSAEPGLAENSLRYPPLGRPATVAFQSHVMEQVERFAAEIGDITWKPRLWLAAATALIVRVAFHAEREVAAVLYGEAVRLLHELTRHLDQGQQSQQLPALLVPAVANEPSSARSEMPEWVAQYPVLGEVHEGLRALGLRVEADHETIHYHPRRNGQTPFALLAPARREGIARLFLRVDPELPFPASPLKIIPPRRQPDPLNTIVIIEANSTASAVIAVAQACLESIES
jgi:phosphotransferase family enzyme